MLSLKFLPLLAASLSAAIVLQPLGGAHADPGDPPDPPTTQNPTGNSGGFNGAVTTAGSYDPYTGNASRAITDLVVPGADGAYPLEPVINFDLTSHKFLEINVRFSGLNYFPRRSSVISRSE